MNDTYTRWGAFQSIDLEGQYRNSCHKQDCGLATLGIVFLSTPILLFAYSDYLLFGVSSTFYGLATLRGLFLLSSIVAVIALRRPLNQRNFDRLTLGWALALSAVVLAVTMTRPPSYLHHSLIDMMILLSLYFTLPLPVPKLFAAPIFFTIGSLLIIYLLRDPLTGMQRNVIWISYLIGNALGIFTSWRLQYYRRERFIALTRELHVRQALEDALDNVKRLEGMLPICAHCKKVRGDNGEWKILEVFLREKTDAEFTHGYCPDCMADLYPETGSDSDAGASGDGAPA